MDKHSPSTDEGKLTELKPTAKIDRKCELTDKHSTDNPNTDEGKTYRSVGGKESQ